MSDGCVEDLGGRDQVLRDRAVAAHDIGGLAQENDRATGYPHAGGVLALDRELEAKVAHLVVLVVDAEPGGVDTHLAVAAVRDVGPDVVDGVAAATHHDHPRHPDRPAYDEADL